MPRFVRLIWVLLALHLTLGMLAYAHFLVTGQYSALGWYFGALGTLFFLVMTATECCLAIICRSWFDSDEPMRLAWGMIACAALARLAGVLLRAVSDGHLPWGNWHRLSLPSGELFVSLSQLGLVVGGPLSMAFLAVGLGRVLAIQRKFHLIGSLTRGDQALLFLVVAFSISQLFINLPLLGNHPSLGTMLLWLSDPLLSLLLIEAILVRRSVIRMGQGLVAKCWGMFVLAIVITSAGDAAIWASSHNLLSESMTALSWYIWFVAAAAFASAPAYQLAAISLTREHSFHSPERR
ncbi:MAG: hypothetical protein P4L26_10595 [Terracidiphilus sp.]|nr:hypothetical protein [Terracidiphilus sp.]